MLFISCMLFCGACSDNTAEKEPTSAIVGLDKPIVSEVSYNSAIVQVNIKGALLKEAGICYGTTSNPNVLNNAIKGNEGSNSFSMRIKGLSLDKTYYVKSYTIDSENELYYSEATSFTTRSNEQMEALENYEPPTYSDNYAPIADWQNHSQWNLANVHDPTVFKAEDGYYYMYQTDASYGYAADKGGGHFFARRSKDLVYWEYMDGSMLKVLAWVKEKLNGYRETLGLEPIESPNYGYWAPVARKVRDGLYRLYYCIVINDPIEVNHDSEPWEKDLL